MSGPVDDFQRMLDDHNRLARMLNDPDAYFAEARQRAREMVERDVQRDLARRRAAFWRRLRFWRAS